MKGSQGGKYNNFLRNCFDILPRQALHAKTLGFKHPEKGEYMNFDSDLPSDMVEVIEKWKTYLGGIAR